MASMPYLTLDPETVEFVMTPYDGEVRRFPGTVKGAISLYKTCKKEKLDVRCSSDLNHPEDFPMFEDHSIDIVMGDLEGAINAGLIAVKKS